MISASPVNDRFLNLVIEPQDSGNDRTSFRRGVVSLDDYIHKQARQDVKRRINRVFAATEEKRPSLILGYYILSTLAIDLNALPQALTHKLPQHPLPAALIGRLAVSQDAQGHGVGKMLLIKVSVKLGEVHSDPGFFGFLTLVSSYAEPTLLRLALSTQVSRRVSDTFTNALNLIL